MELQHQPSNEHSELIFRLTGLDFSSRDFQEFLPNWLFESITFLAFATDFLLIHADYVKTGFDYGFCYTLCVQFLIHIVMLLF